MQQRAFIIGMGEVGRRLASALRVAGWSVTPVTRHEGWGRAGQASDPSPRIVAVREEALQAVLDRLPGDLRERTVLVQNGFLEAVHGDPGPVTRGLVYFTSKGEFFRILCASPFHGPLAGTLAESLDRGGIPAEAIGDRVGFLEAMIVKGIWNCVVGLPLQVHGVDLGTYFDRYRGELDELADESARAAGAEYRVAVSGKTAVRKILDTTTALRQLRGGAKALPWRNGAIVAFGRRHRIPTPVNERLIGRLDPE